jgi:hypothetical protein
LSNMISHVSEHLSVELQLQAMLLTSVLVCFQVLPPIF